MLCSNNKGADQLRGNRETDHRHWFHIICRFAYADCWFSYVVADFLIHGCPISQQHGSGPIRITCLCNIYTLIPHFYIAKLGYAGVCLFFLIFAL